MSLNPPRRITPLEHLFGFARRNAVPVAFAAGQVSGLLIWALARAVA